MDYSIDFIANDGKLTCGKPGQEIEDYILSRIETYLDHQEDIFLQWMSIMRMTCTTLRHNFFPPHNIYGTNGRSLYGKVGEIYEKNKHNSQVHYLDKTRYDSFYGTPLDSLLRERDIKNVEIVGVCTDICVLHTAISAYNLGYNVTIPSRGVASFNQEGHIWALAHFQNSLGAKVED